MTNKFDMNIDYRNALYGSAGAGEDNENAQLVRFLGVTIPSFIFMVVFVVLICCCTRSADLLITAQLGYLSLNYKILDKLHYYITQRP